MIEGGLLQQLTPKIEDSNRKHTCSRGVSIDHLSKETTIQQHSRDEQKIALLLSESSAKDNTQGMDVSNEPTKDIEGNGNLKIENCV